MINNNKNNNNNNNNNNNGIVENIKKVSGRATLTETQKPSACWDLHESLGGCLVYEQND